MIKIDAIDRQIIKRLMDDGRMASAEIARQIGVSERAVRYRIQRLVENNIIQVTAVVNPHTLGFSVIADVFIEVEPALIMDVAKTLAEHENVSYVACSIGERDISAQIVARDANEIYSLATEFIGQLPGVRKTTTSILPVKLKDVYEWYIPDSDAQEAD